MALTKNREDELVEIHEQGKLKKPIPSSTQARIGAFIDAAHSIIAWMLTMMTLLYLYDRMEVQRVTLVLRQSTTPARM